MEVEIGRRLLCARATRATCVMPDARESEAVAMGVQTTIDSGIREY
jgi:hypothetical protein